MLVRSGAASRQPSSKPERARSWLRAYERAGRSCGGDGGKPGEPVEGPDAGRLLDGLLRRSTLEPCRSAAALSAYARNASAVEIKPERPGPSGGQVKRPTPPGRSTAARAAQGDRGAHNTLGRQTDDAELIERLAAAARDLIEARKADMVFIPTPGAQSPTGDPGAAKRRHRRRGTPRWSRGDMEAVAHALGRRARGVSSISSCASTGT